MGLSSPETEKGDALASPQDHSALSYVSAVDGADDERAPTEEELRTLRFTPGPMSWVSILVCFVEFAERASMRHDVAAEGLQLTNRLLWVLPRL